MSGERARSGASAGLLAAPILSYGFRAFFLCAGIHASLSMLAWMAWIGLHLLDLQVVRMTISLPVHLWHAQEMLLGYGLAVVAGFFLTAVPDWTKRRPLQGGPLAILLGLWLAARAAAWSSAYLSLAPAAVFDLLFIAALAIVVARALLTGWSKRNFVFLPTFIALFAAALLIHLDNLEVWETIGERGLRLALDTLLLLIAVVGGRIVPAFTTNALRRRGGTALPRAQDARDVVAVGTVVAVLLADLVVPGSVVSGILAVAAGLANAVRMRGWRTGAVLRQPILWILHLGYGWLFAGFLLRGLALLEGSILESTTLHAHAIGAVGSMTLGVMTRAGLGHTGRPLRVARPIVLAYGLVSLAAALRLAGPALLPELYSEAMLLAGTFWIVAFALFTLVYWPILTRPRADVATDAPVSRPASAQARSTR